MLKCRKEKGERKKEKVERRTATERVLFYLLPFTFFLTLSGCRQDMQDQPRYEPYESSTFFKDGLSSRAPVEGTVPRGYLRADKELFTGQKAQAGANNRAQTAAAPTANGNSNAQAGSANQQGNQNANTQGGTTQQTSGAAQQPAGDASDADEFPFPVTQEVLERGRERFEIFCTLCHGYTGEGDGMIVRRGFRKPPSYHEPRLQQARVGYFFRVMTEGYGAMPSYRAQVPVQDRWAIAAYIRALQLSFMNQTQSAQPASNAAPAHANTEGGGH